MKQLLILSGKGGTGKTTIAGAFITLSGARAYADCDVDAPNLHLLLGHGSEPKQTDYFGLSKAEIDPSRCTSCGRCRQHCRFGAILAGSAAYKIDLYACEGCGVCQAVCPADAVSLVPAVAGELMLHAGDGRTFSTARLKMGSGTSGMLVTEVKKQMKAALPGAELAIIDGSPGIGCPVIASMSGVDMVLIVAEPSVSGISDMERIVKTAEGFGTKTAVCINKYDTNKENSEKIMEFCMKRRLPFTGRIPFDKQAVRAVNHGQAIVEIDCAAGRAVREVFNRAIALLYKESDVDGV
ncbi:ATP-binding protein [Desulforamulus ruminis]|uniref:Cobyrinic acid ac-diamide synthase n=1 Tax=Desulforamulus ruminis (strain ATCC 23193 / DSM 2154 / NCIMB 8452 / DL) TaxID=696281 RepID=F6DVA1_DESRL|nr:ATP-binding protein [Desulforamulus ruminis]AEG60254.1 cobyrinic acid ac-diamide synthase [Desulforamulus ruminis DSM 2154]